VSIERPETSAPSDDARTTREDVRVAYKTAVDLWITSTNQTWARFNVLLLANSILVAIGQFVVANKLAVSELWFLVFPISGFFLCCLWGAVLSRGLQYETCYRKAVQEIEQTHLSPTMAIVSKCEQARSCMKGIGRLPAHVAARGVVLLFVLLHIAVAGWIVYRWYKYPSEFGGV